MTLFILLTLCLFVYNCSVDKKQEIKQSIQYKDIEIRLLKVDPYSIPDKGIANIIAVDSAGNVIWQAEPPKSARDSYWSMELDTSRNLLVVNTGNSFQHLINLENGEVIEYYMIK